jgi:hypothetical protein
MSALGRTSGAVSLGREQEAEIVAARHLTRWLPLAKYAALAVPEQVDGPVLDPESATFARP